MKKVKKFLNKFSGKRENVNEDIRIKNIQKEIKYKFKEIKILKNSLLHRSYVNDKKNMGILLESNERLEFLGDAVLEIIVSEYLFTKYPELPEGKLTKMRANAVCEKTLAQLAKRINLGEYIYLAKGEIQGGGREKASIVSDAFEALIGAIYLDGGFTAAKKFINDNIITKVEFNYMSDDFKSRLQEILQKNSNKKIQYTIIEEDGPAHKKRFVSQVTHGEEVIGSGEGKSKKEAEQNAAHKALENMDLL